MTSPPTCWSSTEPPVVTGARPTSTTSLADLAQPASEGPPRTGRPTPHERAQALLPLHSTVHLLEVVLLAPWVGERLLVTVAPDQLGWVSTELEPRPWVGSHTTSSARPTSDATARLGAQLARLLDPVVVAVSADAGVGVRAGRLVAYDALLATALRLERRAGAAEAGWAAELVAACGHTPRLRGTTIEVRPDHGPAVRLPVPRTCCVLAVRPPDDACPTCPLHADDAARVARTLTWLAELDDDGFASVAGRPRHHDRR